MHIAYDPRFGLVQLHIESTVRVPLKELLGTLKVTPEEFAALLQPNHEWTEGTGTIDSARDRMLSETLCQGKTVLDIGGHQGEAAKRLLDQGASRAICVDNQQFVSYGWEEKQLPGVEYVKADFMDWKEPADIVVFWNVLYHLKNPWRGLDHLSEEYTLSAVPPKIAGIK